MPNLKLRIANLNEKEKKEEEKQKLTLGLIYDGDVDDNVTLIATDKNGFEWCVADVTSKGTLVLIGDLPDDLFQIDEDGCIKVEKEE